MTVLAISIDDQGPDVVKRYADRRELTFPILHDQGHKVSSLYQARSIPTIYLISPEQKAVGLLRGSSSWENKKRLEMVQKLIAIKKLPSAKSLTHCLNQVYPRPCDLLQSLGSLTRVFSKPERGFLVLQSVGAVSQGATGFEFHPLLFPRASSSPVTSQVVAVRILVGRN